MSLWSDTKTATLRNLFDDGLSCSEIAAVVGGVSRNAVIGKLYRLGLRRGPDIPPVRLARPRRSPQRIRLNRIGVAERIEVALPQELPAESIPLEQRKSLLDLTNTCCRWPYGDVGTAEFFFCGKPQADLLAGRSYCRFHTMRAAA